MISKTKLSKIYKLIINCAVGINMGLILVGLTSGAYELIPLAVINCLLLATAFLPIEPKDPR